MHASVSAPTTKSRPTAIAPARFRVPCLRTSRRNASRAAFRSQTDAAPGRCATRRSLARADRRSAGSRSRQRRPAAPFRRDCRCSRRPCRAGAPRRPRRAGHRRREAPCSDGLRGLPCRRSPSRPPALIPADGASSSSARQSAVDCGRDASRLRGKVECMPQSGEHVLAPVRDDRGHRARNLVPDGQPPGRRDRP